MSFPCLLCDRPLATVGARFWTKVDVRGADECWEWLGALQRNGYGRLGMHGYPHHTAMATRVSWVLNRGSLSGDLSVCHKCDNPPCVNPNHLFLGSHADNMRDMKAKGRGNVGERNGMARLTRAAANEIVRRYRAGGVTQQALAAEYGVTFQAISKVVRGERWAAN